MDHVRNAVAKLRSQVLVPECPPDPHSLCRSVVAKGHQMGVHFTNHSPQLGVLVVVGVIVNADQDVFDGLCHDGALPMEPNWHQQIWAGLGETWAAWVGESRKRLVARGAARWLI